MYYNYHIAFELPHFQYKYLSILCWRSLSDWRRERVALSVAYEARSYRIYEWLQPIATQITNGAWPIIVDALVMLILQWAIQNMLAFNLA